jgi:hypothetical protein
VLDASRHGTLEGFEGRIEVPGAVVADAAYKERRRPGHSVCAPLLEVLLDALPGLVAAHVGGEPVHVEAELAGEVEQHALGDRRLAAKDAVVHWPELALLRGSLGGARYELGARVRALVGEVPEHVDQPIAERFAQPHEHRKEAAAVGAEEVSVGDHRDGVSPSAPAHVVTRRVDVSLESKRRGSVAHHRGGVYTPWGPL